MDVKYISADWEKMQSGLKNLFGLGNGKGTIPELKNLNKNLEKAESDIAKHDSDGVISFTHTDRERTYQGLWEDFSVLYQFTGKVGDIVDRTIDQPFYVDMDAFVSDIQQLSILNYTTTNRIGATSVQTYAYHTMEVPKQEISMEDLLNGDNFYSEQMNLEYEAWKEMNVDQDITQAEYQLAALNTRAFGYESIKDGQLKKEFWANIAALVVIVGVSLICPPAGITLGAIYGTAELTSAISGKDWVSGRELDTGERVLRGVLAPVDILPAGTAVRSFSGAARTTRVGTSFKDLGINIKTSVKTSVNNAEIKILELNDFMAMAAKQSEMRLKNANAIVKERVKEIPNKLANKAIDAAKVVDETVTNTKTAFSPKREFAFDGGVVKQSAENTHAVEDSVTKIVGRIPGVNIGDKSVKGTGKNTLEVIFTKEQLATKPSYSPIPRNWMKKGGTVKIDEDGTWVYTNKKGQTVRYTDGYPDFTEYAHPTVKPVEIEIASPTNRPMDYKNANMKAGLNKDSDPPVSAMNKPPLGYIWHHHQDGKTMILVQEKIHAEFTHAGGVSKVNKNR